MRTIGVCVTNDAFLSLAQEAIERFRSFSGLPSILVQTNKVRTSNVYLAKLQVPELVSQDVRIVQFDADAFMVRKFEGFSDFDPDHFYAALDPGRFAYGNHPMNDSIALKMDIRRYFNSGVLIYGNNKKARSVFKRAVELFIEHRKVGDVKDFGEQSFLVKSIQEQNGYFEEMDTRFNYIPFAYATGFGPNEQEPIFVHAAGYTLKKQENMFKSDKRAALDYFSTMLGERQDLVLERNGNCESFVEQPSHGEHFMQ
jgi:lipopolysaccharide biosynthesis glycosyltransferase